MKRIRTATITLLLLPSVAYAQTPPPPSITAHATAQIAAALQIQCSGMQFGSMIAKSTATSLTLPPDGSQILDPNNILLPGASLDAKPSNCSVSGDVAANYSVMVPSSVDLTDGRGHTMTVKTFTVSNDGDSNSLSRLLHNDGTGLGIDTFGVGATLDVGANQVPGNYSGTYIVSVQYN
jgi:hypothetical protein